MACNGERRELYFFIVLTVLSLYLALADGEKIGVCYGTNSNSMPPEDQAVNLLKSNNIGKARLYEANHKVLEALKGSGIEVIVGVDNMEDLKNVASSQAAANGWVKDNVQAFYPSTNIKYIAVGNEVLAPENAQYVPFLVQAMNNIRTALKSANLQNIKVSTPHAFSVLSNSYPPSKGTFGSDMKTILKFLSDNGSPFMAHVYPYFSYKDNRQISADYALFRSTSPVVNDGGRMYNNLFDAMVDALISAMENQGYPNIPIVITESGWPSAGSDVATLDNAQTYNNNLIKHVLSPNGTPKRPGNTIETYIFALFNENLKGGAEDEKHFGLFETNLQAVYPVGFSG
uniref:Glucan endo-1,3-beta-D-glucosidase n=1 Tax=Araucaria cunninghamii TaxID=56994 RepID=A0A0D6QVQ3_ARACU